MCVCGLHAHTVFGGFGGRVVHNHTLSTSTQSPWLGHREEMEVDIRLHVGTG